MENIYLNFPPRFLFFFCPKFKSVSHSLYNNEVFPQKKFMKRVEKNGFQFSYALQC